MPETQNESDEGDLVTKIANMSRSELQLLVNELLADPDMRSKVLERLLSNKKSSVDLKSPKKKVFDINKFSRRKIAFQVQYDGGEFAGFASQDNIPTVESELFAAFLKLNLIADPKSCEYSRCGRTDKGVSALGQVIALRVRSSLPLIPISSSSVLRPASEPKEMDYCTMLNKVLPESIKIIGWTEVSDEFSSRFSATHRTYRYFFLCTNNNLDLEAMRKACIYLLGSHDFRNLCKLDVANVSNFVREIFTAEILPFHNQSGGSNEEVYMLQISGVAFLWHMVRCIMAVLFLVGEGREPPEIIQQLLDISSQPAKPSYHMADDRPLVLHQCGYDHLHFKHSPRALWELTVTYESLLERHTLAAARVKNNLDFIHTLQLQQTDIVELQEELQQRMIKQEKKLQAKGLSSSSITAKSMSRNTTSLAGTKRKAEDDTETDKCMATTVSWKQALHSIQQNINQRPSLDRSPYIPLLQRKVEESYEDRIRTLVGQKKTRLDRHVALSGSGIGDAVTQEGTAEFFQRMRQQGSIDHR